MDALEFLNGALDALRTDLRTSKSELMGRFDKQDRVLESLDDRVREANSKTAKHVTDIALLRRDVDELDTVKFQESRSHALASQDEEKASAKPTNLLAAMTAVLISWGQQKWFPWLAAFLISTVGGRAAFEWGKAIIGLFTPKP